MPVRWPFNVDLFGFVTGKLIDLPVEAADSSPVVARSALTNSSTSVRPDAPDRMGPSATGLATGAWVAAGLVALVLLSAVVSSRTGRSESRATDGKAEQ